MAKLVMESEEERAGRREEKREDDRTRITLSRMVGEVIQALPEMNRAQLRFLAEGLRTLFEATARVR